MAEHFAAQRDHYPEVLAPVGDFERLTYAVNYGADAVYLGGTAFGMRASSANFDFDTMKKAVEYAHARDVKVYLTCNTLPLNSEVEQLSDYLKSARDAGVDAVIVADVGVLMEAKRVIPEVDIHISTQTGIVNYLTANELYKMGAKRVVLARELPLEDIRRIRDKTPPELEIEAFVHGAMCMSFSGRCLLSNYMIGRDANRGECAQPCRWGYHLVEEKRPGQYFPIYEDEKGSYILNAKDMCMIEHLDKVIDAGVTSLKIEGRAKSFYYVAVITNAYRQAVDLYRKDPQHFVLPSWLEEETRKVSHRQYSTGFYFGRPEQGQYYENAGYVRQWDVVAVVDKTEGDTLYCTQRNKFSLGETVEIICPHSTVEDHPLSYTVTSITDEQGNPRESANNAMMKLTMPAKGLVLEAGSIIRRAAEQ